MLLTGLSFTTLHAQEEKTQEKKSDSTDEKSDEPKTLIEIRTAMSREQSEIIKELRGNKPGSEEYSNALAKYYGVADKYADKIFAAVSEDPANRVGASMLAQLASMTRNRKLKNKAYGVMLDVARSEKDSDVAMQMLNVIMTGTAKPMMQGEAASLLVKNFGDSEKLGSLAMSMASRFRGAPSPQIIQFLRDVLDNSTNDNVSGPVTYALGKMLMVGSDTKDEGIKLLKSIPKKFAKVKVGRSSLADMVAGEIFELEHLQIGMDVPDIEGEDVDGVEFKLSDYKGKVIVIDFWGDW